MQMNITFDTKTVEKALSALAAETPKVVSKAINDTLIDIQNDEVKRIHDVFTVRRPRFIKQSVKISQFSKPATLTGIIQIADIAGKSTKDILEKFENGKDKTPRRGRSIAIPTSNVRTTKSGTITKNQRPTALKRAFKFTGKNGNQFIAQATKKKGKDPIKVMYTLKPSVRIDSRLRFVDTGLVTVRRVAANHLNKHIAKALSRTNL